MIISVLLIISVIFSIFISLLIWQCPRKNNSIKLKNALVIGGTSGLGKEFVRYLYSTGNKVTITSRNIETARQTAVEIHEQIRSVSEPIDIACLSIDISQEHPYEENETDYDYIFCVPGFSVSKYFKDQTFNDFKDQIDLNYLAIIKALMHYRVHNKKPFTFITIGSTASLFYFPGYSSYSPTKSALFAFVNSVKMELERENISIRIYLCPAMDTRGLSAENKTKPEFTKSIEYTNTIQNPEYSARYFLDNIGTRTAITSDWFTYFNVIKANCEEIGDYLLFPIAVVVVAVSKWYVTLLFAYSCIRKKCDLRK